MPIMNDVAAPKRRKRMVAAIIAGAAALGVVGASAASLGGITSNSLGADTTVVASCDTDGVTLGVYRTTTVTVSGIAAACAGKALALTLKDSGGASLASGTVASIVGTSAAVTMSGTGASANAVVNAAVVISG
jgi:hypothetical protein